MCSVFGSSVVGTPTPTDPRHHTADNRPSWTLTSPPHIKLRPRFRTIILNQHHHRSNNATSSTVAIDRCSILKKSMPSHTLKLPFQPLHILLSLHKSTFKRSTSSSSSPKLPHAGPATSSPRPPNSLMLPLWRDQGDAALLNSTIG